MVFLFKGTDKERGIAAWTASVSEENNEPEDNTHFIEGKEVYDPLIPECLKRLRCLRFVPIFPKYDADNIKKEGKSNKGFSEDNINGHNTKV